jgi:hypothetical protein
MFLKSKSSKRTPLSGVAPSSSNPGEQAPVDAFLSRGNEQLNSLEIHRTDDAAMARRDAKEDKTFKRDMTARVL